MRPRQFIPLAFALAILISILNLMLFPWGLKLFSLVSGSYLVANLVASLLTSIKKGWNYFLLLPLCFAILHLSYGFGFLIGLVKFWNRWGDKKGRAPELASTPAD